MLKSKLELLSNETTGRRTFTVSFENNNAVINMKNFRLDYDSLPALPEGSALSTLLGLDTELSASAFSGLTKLLMSNLKKFDENFRNKSVVNILSVGCGDPTPELNTIFTVFSTFYPTKKFSYVGVDIDSREFEACRYGDSLDNIQIKLVEMDAKDIDGLKKVTNGSVDLIIMNHPNVYLDTDFVLTFINQGIPKLLVENGSLVVMNFVQIEQDRLLNSGQYNFASFGYVRNHGVLSTLNSACGIYDIGLMFSDYQALRLTAAPNAASAPAATSSSAQMPQLEDTKPVQRSIFSPYKSVQRTIEPNPVLGSTFR